MLFSSVVCFFNNNHLKSSHFKYIGKMHISILNQSFFFINAALLQKKNISILLYTHI